MYKYKARYMLCELSDRNLIFLGSELESCLHYLDC